MMTEERAYGDLHALVAARFAQSMIVPDAFFAAEAERIAQACWSMARRFHQGGRLLAFGTGACATDALHVAVEFVHPVIVGKRALPALALTTDSATLSGLMSSEKAESVFARQISALARPQDIAMGFSFGRSNAHVTQGLLTAKRLGLLTLVLCGDHADQWKDGLESADFCFAVRSDDPLAVQETHETLYHILWELVHLFFEHEGVLS